MKNNEVKIILNVTVNGMTATDAINAVKSRLATVEKSAFNIAVLSAYACGVTIPAFGEFGEATCDTPCKNQKDFMTRVNRSEATLSRWIKAIKLIIEAGDFVEYASGLYPFSFDKIINYYEYPEAYSDLTKSDFFKLSARTIETMAKEAGKGKKQEQEQETEQEKETETEQETALVTKEDEAYVTFTYAGTEYKCTEAAMTAFLVNCEVVNK